MISIKKFVISPKTSQVIRIPSKNILSAVAMREDIALYAITDTRNEEKVPYEVRVYGPKHMIDADLSQYTFLGSTKTSDDRLVYHVFYRRVNA